MAQREVLDLVPSESLAVFVVWEPILVSDRESAARRAVGLVPDRRARHYWTDERALAEAFQSAVPVVGEPVWDVYLIYAPGTEWAEEGPPIPSYYMHQLTGRLPAGRLLDGKLLAEKTAEALRPRPEADL